MTLLLDTHVIIWSVDRPQNLSRAALAAVSDPQNQRIMSVATFLEVSTKIAVGKLSLSLPYRDWMTKAIGDLHLSLLDVTLDYGEMLSRLPMHHRDPFDRLIVSQALVDGMPIVSSDAQLDQYGVTRIW